MDYYVGLDGKKEGPFPADRITQMRVAGRINGSTLIWTHGAQWKPLSAFPEFSANETPPLPPQGADIPPLPQSVGASTVPSQPIPFLLQWGSILFAITSVWLCYRFEVMTAANTRFSVAAIRESGATTFQELASQSVQTNQQLVELVGVYFFATIGSILVGIALAIWGAKRLGIRNPWVGIPAAIQALVALYLIID